MDLIEALTGVGLTKHEANLYLTLCKEGQLTGYEASKLSGISRSNAYLALAGLAEKGGAYRVNGEAMNYIAVPAVELTANLRRQQEQYWDYIVKHAPGKEDPAEAFINIFGKSNVIHKMKNMIANARERIYLSLSPGELEPVEEDLRAAVERQLKIVLITALPFRLAGAIVHYHPEQPGQLRLITDSSAVLTGELGPDEANCVYSKNKNLVQLIKDSLTNEIKLIQLTSDGNPVNKIGS
jgi:sugar-specific transcriptional regulator TrmB